MTVAEPQGDDSEAADDADPTRQEMFETLSNERRRMVVHALQRDGATTLRDLSRQVAAWEYDTDPEAVSSQQRRRLYNALQQSHLPKMDENGIVEYDDDRGTVEPTAALNDLKLFLEVVPNKEISWSTYYTLVGAVCVSLTGAVALGVYPFSLFGMTATALFCSLLVFVSGLVHHYRTRQMALGRGGLPEDV
jgi:predicted transcriptional regulator